MDFEYRHRHIRGYAKGGNTGKQTAKHTDPTTKLFLSNDGSAGAAITKDGYLKANAARELFGPDTDVRKLCPVEAKNHSFRDGCSDLFGRTRECLRWITEQESSETGP